MTVVNSTDLNLELIAVRLRTDSGVVAGRFIGATRIGPESEGLLRLAFDIEEDAPKVLGSRFVIEIVMELGDDRGAVDVPYTLVEGAQWM
jgi:hypothetical protein